MACTSEHDGGSDSLRSMFVDDNVDQKILGIFFSKKNANHCCREHLEFESGDEASLEPDPEETFVYDESEYDGFDKDTVI